MTPAEIEKLRAMHAAVAGRWELFPSPETRDLVAALPSLLSAAERANALEALVTRFHADLGPIGHGLLAQELANRLASLGTLSPDPRDEVVKAAREWRQAEEALSAVCAEGIQPYSVVRHATEYRDRCAEVLRAALGRLDGKPAFEEAAADVLTRRKKALAALATTGPECGACWGSGWAQQFVKPCERCGGTGRLDGKDGQ